MGKVIRLKRAKNRRDKKYDPYKLNPIKGLTKELENAIETDDKGEIKLDSAGKPIFKDHIEWETDGAQIMAIWTCIKAVLEEKIVPPNEVDACFDLMGIIAKLHRNGSKVYKVQLPINYFVGTWHILNTCRKFLLFNDDKPMMKAVDGLTMMFARKIDAYHEIKDRERKEDEIMKTSPLPRKIDSTKNSSPGDAVKLLPSEGPQGHNEA